MSRTMCWTGKAVSQSQFVLREQCLLFALEQGRATKVFSSPGMYQDLLLPADVALCTLREECLLFALEQGRATRIFRGPGI